MCVGIEHLNISGCFHIAKDLSSLYKFALGVSPGGNKLPLRNNPVLGIFRFINISAGQYEQAQILQWFMVIFHSPAALPQQTLHA